MLDVHMKLNAGLPGKSGIQQEEDYFISNELKYEKKLLKYCFWSIAVYGAKTWTRYKVYQIYIETFQAWCWRRTDKHIWIDHVQNEEALYRFKEESNTQYTIK